MCIPPFVAEAECRWDTAGILAPHLYDPVRQGHHGEVSAWEDIVRAEALSVLGHSPGRSLTRQVWEIFRAECYSRRALTEQSIRGHVHDILCALTTFVSIASGARGDIARQAAQLGNADDAQDVYQDAMLALWERLRP